MTSKRWALLLSAAMATSTAACGATGESRDESAALDKSETPTQVPTRDRPAVETPLAETDEQRNEPEIDRARAERQGESHGAPQPAPRATSAEATPSEPTASTRRAEAELDTVGDAKLEAEATLQETQDGVQVVVRVEAAKPGTRSVRIYDRADCEDLDDKPLGEPLAGSNKQGDLGSVTIGPSGKGTLETKAFNASLKPDDRASLLGKTIVVQERDGTSPKGDGDPIACGVIKMQDKLADTTGRMAQPTR